jgi:HemY protein
MAYEALLSEGGHDTESIRRVWNTVPGSDRVKPYIAARAAAAFNARGLHDEARSIVEDALTAGWDERVVRAYREAAGPEGSSTLLAQIENCETWQRTHPNDPELELTLGSLCLRQKLWGKAQRYLEQALSDATEPHMVREAHLKLAQLHEALGQREEADNHYRQCALATVL